MCPAEDAYLLVSKAYGTLTQSRDFDGEGDFVAGMMHVTTCAKTEALELDCCPFSFILVRRILDQAVLSRVDNGRLSALCRLPDAALWSAAR